MDKPIYKYATIWGVLGGTALAFIYLKTLGKDKNLALAKTLLIGGGIGGGIGLGIDLSTSSKPKLITESDLKILAESISKDEVNQVDNYLFALSKANLSESDNQRVYKVIKGVLLAKKDNKWDEKADIQNKKKILSNYGVTSNDFNVFQDVITKSITDVLLGALSKEDKK